MGWETALLLGAQVYSAQQQSKQAQREAKSIVEAGNINARNKALEVKRRAAGLTTNFLNSGLLLEGTPMDVINSTYETGIADINAIRKNANTSAKNTISASRNKILSGFASSAAMAYMGGSFDSAPTINNAPVWGQGSWLSQQLSGWGGTDLGDQMPWLSNDPNDILVGKV